MPSRTGRARLSVIVVCFNRSSDLLSQCLTALANQDVSDDVEVLIIGANTTPELETIRSLVPCFPAGVSVHPANGNIPQMRRLGVEKSRGEVVALIEDDCIVAKDWAAALLNAHRGHHVAVGGAVEPGSYRKLLDWAAYLSDYSPFMLPFAAGESTRLPGNNVSYKRLVVEELLAVTEKVGLQEALVHEHWHALGKPMFAEPRAIARNEHRWGFRDLTSMPFFHGRAYGGQRAQHWGAGRRGIFAVGTVLLPFLHIARIVRRVRSRRRRTVPTVRALPWLAVFGFSWAFGECIGYVMGPGDSLQRWR